MTFRRFQLSNYGILSLVLIFILILTYPLPVEAKRVVAPIVTIVAVVAVTAVACIMFCGALSMVVTLAPGIIKIGMSGTTLATIIGGSVVGATTISLATHCLTGSDNVMFGSCEKGGSAIDAPACSQNNFLCPDQKTCCPIGYSCIEGGKCQSGAPPQPVSATFRADRSSAPIGVPFTLSWTSSGATGCVIDQGIGGVKPSGQLSLTCQKTGPLTFNLSCTGPGGETSEQTTVNCLSSPRFREIIPE